MEKNFTDLDQVRKLLNAGLDIYTSDMVLKRNMITKDWMVESNINHNRNVTKITKDGRATEITIHNLPASYVEQEAFIESHGIAPCWSLNALLNTIPENVSVSLKRKTKKSENDNKAFTALMEYANPENKLMKQKTFRGDSYIEITCQMVIFCLENKQYITPK